MSRVHDIELHRGLLHQADSRRHLNTPALVLDRDVLERNIARMAAFASSKSIALRPHAKTHKSVDIARRQLAAGAVGVCCAKLGEAEALAEGGIDDILLTSPVVSPSAIQRLASLRARCASLKVVVDNPTNVATLCSALGGERLDVLIDVDPGIRRTGVADAEAALRLFKAIEGARELTYRGLQYYCGAQQHLPSFSERHVAVHDRTQYLETVIALLSKHGARPDIVSGGGTGSHRIDAELGVLNELQVGSYALMDRQYAECDLGAHGSPFEYALFVDARVVSANHAGMATLDAGFKAMSTDGGPPAIVGGAPPGATFHFMGDEHSAVVDPSKTHAWRIGDLVSLAVPHCDPTVNLYDTYHVVSDETLVDMWPVTARGRGR